MRKETKKELESMTWAAVDINEIYSAIDHFPFTAIFPAHIAKANGWKAIEFADELYLGQKYNPQLTKKQLESETILENIWDLIDKNEKKYTDFFTLLLRSNYDGIKRELANLIKKLKGQIDCTKCANCCKCTITFTKEELERIAVFLDTSEDEVLSRFKKGKDGRFIAIVCPFLKNNLCAVYKVRPKTCRKFPNIAKISAFSRLRHAVCPLIYNAIEEYKSIVSKQLD